LPGYKRVTGQGNTPWLLERVGSGAIDGLSPAKQAARRSAADQARSNRDRLEPHHGRKIRSEFRQGGDPPRTKRLSYLKADYPESELWKSRAARRTSS
jgi:hypothetical protein